MMKILSFVEEWAIMVAETFSLLKACATFHILSFRGILGAI
jgi:hypothetical protein